jgi:hypothetical protein
MRMIYLSRRILGWLPNCSPRSRLNKSEALLIIQTRLRRIGNCKNLQGGFVRFYSAVIDGSQAAITILSRHGGV